MNARPSDRYRLYLAALASFLVLLLLALLLNAVSAWLQGFGLSVLLHPLQWLRDLDQEAAAGSLSDAAQLVANIVAIAITVVAIVVELAANRYSHRITRLFVLEPVNIAVMSLFVITTVQCVWVAATLGAPPVDPIIVNAGYGIAMVLVTGSLLVLLPYFAFVFAFLTPTNIISRIRKAGSEAIHGSGAGRVRSGQARVLEAVDELQDVARRAVELHDRSVAMASLNALADMLLDYQAVRNSLPGAWFDCSEIVAQDPDFVSLAPAPLEDIAGNGTWVEVKILRQYISIVVQGGLQSHEIINLIAINTRRIGEMAVSDRKALLDLCMRCFNSYLRATINHRDQRSSYYVMNEYRQLAEALLESQQGRAAKRIARHLQFYALLACRYDQPFLLEVAAYDIIRLIEQGLARDPQVVDDLLGLLMELDQEIKDESEEDSSLGVRRAQIQLATLFLQRGDEHRVAIICDDLRTEEFSRIERICRQLAEEDRPQYWEITDRGVNFGYLPPERRALLEPLLERLRPMTPGARSED